MCIQMRLKGLAEMDDVLEVVAIGKESPDSGEIVKLFVVKKKP